MHMKKDKLIKTVWDIEGFTIDAEGPENGHQDYRLIASPGNYTVAKWRRFFLNWYPDLSIIVQKGNGEPANGKMLLSNLRKTYTVASIRSEFSKLRDEQEGLRILLAWEKSKNGSVQVESIQIFDPYAVLGVTRDSDLFEVRAAYHRMCRAFHEDRLHHYGLHSDLIRFATKKMQDINAAYHEIRTTLVNDSQDSALMPNLDPESESSEQNPELLIKAID